MPLPVFRIEVQPTAFKSPLPASGKVTVFNTGSKALDVTSRTLHLGGNCGQLHVTPSKFTLVPGQHVHVTVTDRVMNSDLGAVFGAVLHGRHSFGTGGGVAARFTVGHPAGKAVCAAARSVPLHTAAGGGFPWWLAAVMAVLLVLAAVVVTRIIRRKRTAGDSPGR